MDPVSHAAFGRTLIALDSRRVLGTGAIAACVLGSLTPDVDAAFMPLGWDVYLRLHQGGTHSIAGSIGCAALTAAAARAVSRRARYLPLLLAAWMGTGGHLVLDVISGADVRFFWPLGPPVTLPLFAMADPWLGALLVVGLVALALKKTDSRRTAAAILIAISVLGATKAALYARVPGVDGTRGDPVQSSRAEAEWGSLTRWITYEAVADRVRARRVDALARTAVPLVDISRGFDEPLVIRSRDLETVRNFLAAHSVTFATVIGTREAGGQVLWSDLRYCGPLDGRLARWPPWGPVAFGDRLPIACTLWFGGEFDPGGRGFRTAIVYVGHLEQRRAVR